MKTLKRCFDYERPLVILISRSFEGEGSAFI